MTYGFQKKRFVIQFCLKSSFKQNAVLERNRSVPINAATTWKRGLIGTIHYTQVDRIRGQIKDFVDKFILDFLRANEKKSNIPMSKEESKKLWDEVDSILDDKSKKNDSPFTATYVGGNREPEVEIFNDTDRILYIDLGQDTMTAYTIPSKQSKTIPLTEGIYNYKASAARVAPLQGKDNFQKGCRYTWRFTIITVRK